MDNRFADPNSSTYGNPNHTSGKTTQQSARSHGDDTYADDRPKFWLRLASYTYPPHQPLDQTQEEHLRRSRLTAWIILGLIIGSLLLSPIIVNDPVDFTIVFSLEVTFLLAVLFNHHGWTTVAGIIMILVIMFACIAAPLFYPGGLHLDELPDFDLMALTVALAAVILPPKSAWLAMLANIITFCVVFLCPMLLISPEIWPHLTFSLSRPAPSPNSCARQLSTSSSLSSPILAFVASTDPPSANMPPCAMPTEWARLPWPPPRLPSYRKWNATIPMTSSQPSTRHSSAATRANAPWWSSRCPARNPPSRQESERGYPPTSSASTSICSVSIAMLIKAIGVPPNFSLHSTSISMPSTQHSVMARQHALIPQQQAQLAFRS